MPKIDSVLAANIHANPGAIFPIIVRVQGDMDACQTELETAGLVISRRMWLIHGFAGSAAGTTIETLAQLDWIVSVESDQAVQTM